MTPKKEKGKDNTPLQQFIEIQNKRFRLRDMRIKIAEKKTELRKMTLEVTALDEEIGKLIEEAPIQ